jgi:hypothetical protein
MNTIGKLPATKKDVEIAIEKAVDTIADMIGKGAAHNDTRFDAIESRLGKIENLLITFQSGPIYYRLSGPLEPASANQHPCVMAGSHDRAQAPSLLNL